MSWLLWHTFLFMFSRCRTTKLCRYPSWPDTAAIDDNGRLLVLDFCVLACGLLYPLSNTSCAQEAFTLQIWLGNTSILHWTCQLYSDVLHLTLNWILWNLYFGKEAKMCVYKILTNPFYYLRQRHACEPNTSWANLLYCFKVFYAE